MRVEDLYNFSQWYENNVIRTDFLKAITEINNLINRSLKVSQESSGFLNSVYDSFAIAHRKIRSDQLLPEYRKMVQKIGLEYIILEPALSRIKKLAIDDRDPHAASAIFSNIKRTIELNNSIFSNLNGSIEHLFDTSSMADIDYKGKVLARLTFHKKASINNVVELSNWSAKLEKIARGYSMVVNGAAEDFEVAGAYKGSIIIDLLMNVETMSLMAETIKSIVEAIAGYYSIKLLMTQLSNFGKTEEDSSAEVLEKIEDMIKRDRDAKLGSIFDKIKRNHPNIDGDVETNLRSSIRELHDFLDKGGEIDFQADEEVIEQNEEILLVNEALKQLKENREVKRIEHKPLE